MEKMNIERQFRESGRQKNIEKSFREAGRQKNLNLPWGAGIMDRKVQRGSDHVAETGSGRNGGDL